MSIPAAVLPTAPVLATDGALDAEVVDGRLEGAPVGGVVQAELADKGLAGKPTGDGPRPAHLRRFVRRSVGLILSITDWLFGVAALIIGLSFLSTYPLLQMLSLGYLIEVSGRI